MSYVRDMATAMKKRMADNMKMQWSGDCIGLEGPRRESPCHHPGSLNSR